jgi:hypothetical protein
MRETERPPRSGLSEIQSGTIKSVSPGTQTGRAREPMTSTIGPETCGNKLGLLCHRRQTLSHRWSILCHRWQTGPLFFFYLFLSCNIETTLVACLPCWLTLISFSLTSSFIALLLVLAGILVTSIDSTISPPTCSHLNASNRIVWANWYVLTLLDCRSALTHRRSSLTHAFSSQRVAAVAVSPCP